MTTLQLARYEVQAQARGQARVHPIRFVVGAVITASGAALFLAQVAQSLVTAI